MTRRKYETYHRIVSPSAFQIFRPKGVRLIILTDAITLLIQHSFTTRKHTDFRVSTEKTTYGKKENFTPNWKLKKCVSFRDDYDDDTKQNISGKRKTIKLFIFEHNLCYFWYFILWLVLFYLNKKRRTHNKKWIFTTRSLKGKRTDENIFAVMMYDIFSVPCGAHVPVENHNQIKAHCVRRLADVAKQHCPTLCQLLLS